MKNKTILVCPLDWGLGHATRMVPVINLLKNKGARVIIGADNNPFSYLKQRFPELEIIRFPGFHPRYPKSGNMAMMMVRSYPAMRSAASNANGFLQEIIIEKEIDIVISDNRYELYSDKAFTVFITHQLIINTPGFSKLAKPVIQSLINNYIKKYDELWIPDFDGNINLSGSLSHQKKFPVENSHFIGPLSRFSLIKPKPASEKPDLLILLSGPEPQRTILEELLVKQASETNYKTVVLRGLPGINDVKKIKKITLYPHLDDEKIAGLILSAKNIICRPGYSTIMDLAVLGKNAIFIPTPGQTEQGYLAKHIRKSAGFTSYAQSTFNLNEALISQSFIEKKLSFLQENLLESRVNHLLKLNSKN